MLYVCVTAFSAASKAAWFRVLKQVFTYATFKDMCRFDYKKCHEL